MKPREVVRDGDRETGCEPAGSRGVSRTNCCHRLQLQKPLWKGGEQHTDRERCSDMQTPFLSSAAVSQMEAALLCLKVSLCFTVFHIKYLSLFTRGKRKVKPDLTLQVPEGKNEHFVTRTSMASPQGKTRY